MTGMKRWMLGAAMVAGAALVGAPPANAARVGIYVGAGTPAAYVPPCPGPGYAWVDGYYADGYWVPGYWNYVGLSVGVPAFRGRVYFDHDRGWDRGRDFDREHRVDHFRR